MRRLLVGAPLLVLLCAQIGLFVWMAGRGLDFTDESYYLLSYQHWRSLTATATFFGAYFEPAFLWFGGDVGAMRVLGMTLLVAGGGFFAWRAFLFGSEATEPTPWIYIAGGMAGAFYYYSFVTTLRAPSYNLLVLFSMLMSSGLLLILAESQLTRVALGGVALAYGVLVGACAFAKAPSALAMVACHLAFLLRFARAPRILDWAALAGVGVGVNVLALQMAQPHWFDVLLEGVRLTTTLDGRYATIPFGTLSEAIVRGAVRLLPSLAAAALLFAFVVRRWGRAHRAVLSWLVVLLVAGIMLTIQRQGYGKSWWVLLAFGTALLWLAERLCRDAAMPRWCDVRGVVGLSALLFALPICYSIGTNGSLPAHTQMAAVFAVIALMLPLRRLRALGLIHGSALMVALVMLSVPMLVSQLRSLEDPSYTYRLRTGLHDQRVAIPLGSAHRVLRLDAVTRDNLAAFAQAMADAGYRAGEPILDATGDGPGLVYALGGRPLGTAWMIGGYSGSARVLASVLERTPADELRRVWLLTADDNPRALHAVPELVRERTRDPGPQRAGAISLVAQYRWDGLPPDPVVVTIWKPSASTPPLPRSN